MPRGMKNNQGAANVWGSHAYAGIPKSVFALLAYHLANACSAQLDNDAAAKNRFKEEIEALRDNGIVSESQANAALKALAQQEAQ